MLDISADVKIFVGDEVISSRPIPVSAGDVVKAHVRADPNPTQHVIVPYTVDGVPSNFIIASATPFFAGLSDTAFIRRWWDYTPQEPHLITYRTNDGRFSNLRDLGYNEISLLSSVTAVPDPKTSALYFYDDRGRLLDSLQMPAPPTQVAKFDTAEESFFVVACTDLFIYKVSLAPAQSRQPALNAENNDVVRIRKNKNDWLFLLSFEQDLPFQGSFYSSAGFTLNLEKPQPKCLSVFENSIWVAAYGKVWVLDRQFAVQQTIDIVGQPVGIQAYAGGAVVSTMDGIAYKIETGSTTTVSTLYQGVWLTNPVLFGTKVAVGDANDGMLFFYDTEDEFAESSIYLGEFSPSYMSANATNIFITGHDTPDILVFDGTAVTKTSFSDKATWPQAVPNGVIVSHYLRELFVLDHSGRNSVVPFEIPAVESGVSRVGTAPTRIINLGAEGVIATVPEGVTYWADGVVGGPINNYSLFSIATKLDAPGNRSIGVAIGEIAFDFKIAATEQTVDSPHVEIPQLPVKNGLAQYDISVTDQMAGAAASLDYGYLLQNFYPYLGTPLVAGDILSVCIPMGKAQNMVSMLTIGKTRLYVHANPGTSALLVSKKRDLPTNSLGRHTITVDTTGVYTIPEYYTTVTTEVSRPFNVQSMGGAASPLYPFALLNAAANKPTDERPFAFVPNVNGLFDVYFDAQTPQLVTKYKIMAQDRSAAPKNFSILASNDLQTWTTIAVHSSIPASMWTPTVYTDFAFSNTTPYRYWRLYNTSTISPGVAIEKWAVEIIRPEATISAGGQPLLPGQRQLAAGTVLTFELAASPRLYDARQIKIAGPKNIVVTSLSSAYYTVATLPLGSLTAPSIRSINDSAPQLISGAVRKVTLATTDSLASIALNDTNVFTSSLDVETDDEIIFRKIIRNLAEPSAYLYQKQFDESYGRNTVYVDVGRLDIVNDTTAGPLADPGNVVRNLAPFVQRVDRANVVTLPSAAKTRFSDNLYYSANITANAVQHADITANGLVPVLARTSVESTSPNGGSATFTEDTRNSVQFQALVKDETSASYSTPYPADAFNGTDLTAIGQLLHGIFNDVNSKEALKLLTQHFHENTTIVSPLDSVLFTEEQRIVDHLPYLDMNEHTYVSLVFNSIKQEEVPKIVQVIDSVIIHDNEKIVDRIEAFIRFDNPKDAAVFASVVEYGMLAAGPKITMTPDPYSEKVVERINYLLTRPNYRNTDVPLTYLVPVDGKIISDHFDYLKTTDSTLMLTRMGTIVDEEIIWTASDIENYGAFWSQSAAETAATQRQHTPFIAYRIYQSEKWTYRKLSDIQRVCMILPTDPTYVLGRLLQGG